MLSVFNVRRNDETITIWVDHEGMRLETLKNYPSKEVQFASWKMAEFPEAFIASAEKALEGYKGYSSGFIVAGLVDGDFRARPETMDWIDFHITIDGKSVSMQLRRSEVVLLINKLRNYWNVGSQIVHQGQVFDLAVPYSLPSEVETKGEQNA